MDLDTQAAELERMGFAIASRTEDEVVATRRKWCWDCFFTNLTLVVFVKATGPLSAADIQGETEQHLARARELDEGGPPLGLQHARAAIHVYLADSVEPDAQELCTWPQAARFSVMSFPAALDLSTGQAHFLRETRMWGGIYYAKLRFVAARLLEPAAAPAKEPVSVLGLALIVLIGGMFAVTLLLALIA